MARRLSDGLGDKDRSRLVRSSNRHANPRLWSADYGRKCQKRMTDALPISMARLSHNSIINVRNEKTVLGTVFEKEGNGVPPYIAGSPAIPAFFLNRRSLLGLA